MSRGEPLLSPRRFESCRHRVYELFSPVIAAGALAVSIYSAKSAKVSSQSAAKTVSHLLRPKFVAQIEKRSGYYLSFTLLGPEDLTEVSASFPETDGLLFFMPSKTSVSLGSSNDSHVVARVGETKLERIKRNPDYDSDSLPNSTHVTFECANQHGAWKLVAELTIPQELRQPHHSLK